MKLAETDLNAWSTVVRPPDPDLHFDTYECLVDRVRSDEPMSVDVDKGGPSSSPSAPVTKHGVAERPHEPAPRRNGRLDQDRANPRRAVLDGHCRDRRGQRDRADPGVRQRLRLRDPGDGGSGGVRRGSAGADRQQDGPGGRHHGDRGPAQRPARHRLLGDGADVLHLRRHGEGETLHRHPHQGKLSASGRSPTPANMR